MVAARTLALAALVANALACHWTVVPFGEDVASPCDAADDAGRACAITLAVAGCTADGVPCPRALIAPVPDGGAGEFVALGPIVAHGIVVSAGVTLRPAPWQPGVDGSGQLSLDALDGQLFVEATAALDASGQGYGGGGGGGGAVYDEPARCPAMAPYSPSVGGTSGGLVDGAAGTPPTYQPQPPPNAINAQVCPRPGGLGGGGGGNAGSDGVYGAGGAGGAGAGAFGGHGGVAPMANGLCDSLEVLGMGALHEADGLPGAPGGYRAAGANGDATPDADDTVGLGSGGGGGSGALASSGYCCGGGLGGSGGVAGAGPRLSLCNSGGGGSGGAAGGGSVRLHGAIVRLAGRVAADGAGDAAVGAGYGAGGGVLIVATELVRVESSALLSSRGGASAGHGAASNGGTVKLRGRVIRVDGDLASHVTAGATSALTR